MFTPARLQRYILITIIGLLVLVSPKIALAGLEIKPTGEVIGSYDDNITRLNKNKIGGYSTKLLGGIGLDLLEKTLNLHFDADLGYEFFANHHKFNSFSQYANLDSTVDFSNNGQLKIADTYSHTKEPQTFEAIFNRPSGLFFTHHNYAKAEYSLPLSKQLSWGLTYINDLYSNQIPPDTDMNQISTEIGYAIDSATIVSPVYSYSRMDFDPGSSATTNEASFKLRRFLTQQTYVDFQAGEDFIKDFGGKNSAHPAFRAFLTTDVDERTQTVFSISREYSVTPYTQELFSGWRVSSTLSKKFLSRLEGVWNLFYASGRYIPSSTKESFVGTTLGLNYDLTKNTKFNFNYTFFHDKSDIEANTYSRNVVTCGIRVEL